MRELHYPRRVIAAPVGGRTLAEHDAEVLCLKAPPLPGNFHLDIDTGHGKLAAQLDLCRARVGGSYLLRVSLCQTGHWIYHMAFISHSGRDELSPALSIPLDG
jgi:hypothetical protein